MDNLSVICTSLIILSTANGQTVQYVQRFRNFSIESETDSIYLVSFNLYQDKHYHKISAVVNVTKDILFKNAEVVLHRCSFEKTACENFLRWKFTRNLRTTFYMKNQMWSPLFNSVTPKLDTIPLIKKNVYRSKDMSLDAKEVVKFYPEVTNYLWRVNLILNDHDDKKAVVTRFEGIVFPFVKRNRTRTRGNTSTEKTGN